jgi:hypothetical protein
MYDRLTLPWALLVLIAATVVGIQVNTLVEAKWIAPSVMALFMAVLFFWGRIDHRRKRHGDGNNGER